MSRWRRRRESLAQAARVAAAAPQAHEEARGAGQRVVQRGAPVAGHRSHDHRPRAVGAQFHPAALVDAAARAVHVRHLHLGAWHQPAQAPQHEAHAPFGQVAQVSGLRMAGLEEHLHHGSPAGLGKGRNLRHLPVPEKQNFENEHFERT
jgi:hypothetical protein